MLIKNPCIDLKEEYNGFVVCEFMITKKENPLMFEKNKIKRDKLRRVKINVY